MIKNNAKIKIKLSGVNLNRIYKECQKSNIVLYSIKQIDHKTITFKIDNSQIENLREIAQSNNYTFEVLKMYGVLKIASVISKRIGIVIGAVIFCLSLVINSFFVWDIRVYGLDNVDKEQIISILNSQGLKSGVFYKSQDLDKIEKLLLDNIDQLSLCSVIKKGTTIIVNVKEKLATINFVDNSQADLVATENMTITEITVVQGTPLKKVGDSVKKGETIVAGYYLGANGEKVTCKANAKISATTWFTATEVYPKQKEVYVRTGNKIENRYMTWLGVTSNIKISQNNFENFETERREKYIFSNNLLPCKYVTEIFYETQQKIISQDFSADKASLIEKLTKQAIEKVPTSYVVCRTFENISETETEFIVTCYAEIQIQL